jgi:hypothetical protein
MFCLKEARDSQSRFSVSAVSYRFKRCHWHCGNRFSSVNDTAETVSAVSLTPRKLFQWCQCHQWNGFSGVIDTAEIRPTKIFVVEITMISRSWWFPRCHWYRWNRFRGVIDTAETISAVPMTPLKRFQTCQWHDFRGVNDTAETVSEVSTTLRKQLWGSGIQVSAVSMTLLKQF